MSQKIDNEQLGAFTEEFFKLTEDQQKEALRNFLIERNSMADDLENKTQILAANQGTINNLPIVNYKGEKYQFRREKVTRKHENTSVELLAEKLSKDLEFIEWAVTNKSGLLRKLQ